MISPFPASGSEIFCKRCMMAYNKGIEGRRRGVIRVAPYFEEKEIFDGLSFDVTDQLDCCWYAGYDGRNYPGRDDLSVRSRTRSKVG
jgi:hypothetical protein